MSNTGSVSTSNNAETRLEAARDCLQRERRRTTDELEALHAFEDRLRAIHPERPSSKTDPTGGVAVSIGSQGVANGLTQVQDAYEATVMSVPHYCEEYDDTYGESLGEEFSPDIAVRLTRGTTFDEHCKRAVLSAVSESQTARQRFLSAVSAEAESLDTATEELVAVEDELTVLAEIRFSEHSFGALDAHRTYLTTLEGHCEACLQRRQEAVFEQRRDITLPADTPDIARYLYQELPAAYPVMAVIADLLEWIAELRGDIERAMMFCHE